MTLVDRFGEWTPIVFGSVLCVMAYIPASMAVDPAFGIFAGSVVFVGAAFEAEQWMAARQRLDDIDPMRGGGA